MSCRLLHYTGLPPDSLHNINSRFCSLTYVTSTHSFTHVLIYSYTLLLFEPRATRDELNCPKFHQKCLFANAWPEPDFRYFSNDSALRSLTNRKATTICQGAYLTVYGEWPELCSLKRFCKSVVIPIYRLPG